MNTDTTESGEERHTDEGDDSPLASPADDVRTMAMTTLGLLRHDQKKACHQVKQLVKANKSLAFSVLTADIGGWTPVHACALRGSKKLLKQMLQAGIGVNATMGIPEDLPARCTLLHIAANRSDKKVLDYLLHHGADVNARDSDGHTPIFYARRVNNRDSVRLLMDCGATAEDSYGPYNGGGRNTAAGGGNSASASSSGAGGRMTLTQPEDILTPEPRLTKFCFRLHPSHGKHSGHS